MTPSLRVAPSGIAERLRARLSEPSASARAAERSSAMALSSPPAASLTDRPGDSTDGVPGATGASTAPISSGVAVSAAGRAASPASAKIVAADGGGASFTGAKGGVVSGVGCASPSAAGAAPIARRSLRATAEPAAVSAAMPGSSGTGTLGAAGASPEACMGFATSGVSASRSASANTDVFWSRSPPASGS